MTKRTKKNELIDAILIQQKTYSESKNFEKKSIQSESK